MYHIPVLLHECIEGLHIKPNGTYVDVTFGGGGHSGEILRHLGPDGHLYSFDQDKDAEQNIFEGDERFTFVRSNFRYLKNWMQYYGVEGIDGLIADLGVSSHHFDTEERGFSFRFDAPLDMRMNGRSGRTAADIVNTYDSEKLAHVFRLYGELRQAHRLAEAVVKARATRPVATINDLLDAVERLLPRERAKKDLARLFQALRIEVNHEMDALEELLEATLHCLRPGGRLVVLTYHSLEDRMVKNFIRAGRISGEVEEDFYGRRLTPWETVNRKVIVPSPQEQADNPRSRSAKLRIAERR